MSYHCRDCSFSAKQRFPEGRCPACGSFAIESGRTTQQSTESVTASRLRLAIMIGLWGFLIWSIADKIG